MNQAKNATITFHIGDATETLSGTEYVSWYTGGENGVITVDRDKAAAYIKALAAKYDTAGTGLFDLQRSFGVCSTRKIQTAGHGRILGFQGVAGHLDEKLVSSF